MQFLFYFFLINVNSVKHSGEEWRILGNRIWTLENRQNFYTHIESHCSTFLNQQSLEYFAGNREKHPEKSLNWRNFKWKEIRLLRCKTMQTIQNWMILRENKKKLWMLWIHERQTFKARSYMWWWCREVFKPSKQREND